MSEENRYSFLLGVALGCLLTLLAFKGMAWAYKQGELKAVSDLEIAGVSITKEETSTGKTYYILEDTD